MPQPSKVEIGTVGDTTEGAMIREYLESHGIECLLQGEHHRGQLQMLGSYIELRLLVPEEQAEEARALLDAFRAESPDDEDEDEDDRPDEEADWRQNSERARKRRGARFVSLALPGFGLGHFTVGATKRGLALLLLGPASIWLATSWHNPMLMLLIPISAAFDFVMAPLALPDAPEPPKLPRATVKDR